MTLNEVEKRTLYNLLFKYILNFNMYKKFYENVYDGTSRVNNLSSILFPGLTTGESSLSRRHRQNSSMTRSYTLLKKYVYTQ